MLYFEKWNVHFPVPALKIFLKKFLIFQKIKLKKLLVLHKKELSYIFPRKTFIIFRKTETLKNSLYFKKRNFLLFREMGTSKKLLIFQEATFWAQKVKRTTQKKNLIFQEMELSSSRLKKLLSEYFRINYLNQPFLILTQRNWFFAIRKISYALSMALLLCANKV